MVGVREEWRTGAELHRAAKREQGDSGPMRRARHVARDSDGDRRRFSLSLSQTNRIIKLPATTATEIESLHFGKIRDFPARAWHVRAHLKSGVVRGIRSI